MQYQDSNFMELPWLPSLLKCFVHIQQQIPFWKLHESASSMLVRIGTFQREEKIILFLVIMSRHGRKIHEKHFDRHRNFISCMYLHVTGSFLILSCVFLLMCQDGFIFNILKYYFSFSSHFHIQTSVRKHNIFNILFTIQTDNFLNWNPTSV